MSNWRKQKPRNNNTNHHQQSSKPPLSNYKHSVPAWEKDFCSLVGSVPWRKLVESKRYMHIYHKVVQWDDSAVEEAFKEAKSRFWAERNGFPCEFSLPDPDVYIDDIDWDAEVDNELILDLERGPKPREEGEESVVIFDSLALLQEQTGMVWGTGWGDAEGINEENFRKPENSWDQDRTCDDSWGRKENWDQKKNDNGFKTETWGRVKNGTNNNNRSYNQKKVQNWNGRDQGRESREWRKKEAPREGGGQRGEDCQWRNGGRGGFRQHSNNGWGWTETF